MAEARHSLAQQIDEIQRELRTRDDVYPRLVASRKLRDSHAEFQMGRLKAALKTLQWLERHLPLIRERCPELFERPETPGKGA